MEKARQSVKEAQLYLMKDGLKLLGELYSLLEENPNQFQVTFDFEGTVPGGGAIGHALVYPLHDGKAIWQVGSSNKKRLARIKLGSGQIEIETNPYSAFPKTQKYGTGIFGSEKILSYEELESLWNQRVTTLKRYISHPEGTSLLQV